MLSRPSNKGRGDARKGERPMIVSRIRRRGFRSRPATMNVFLSAAIVGLGFLAPSACIECVGQEDTPEHTKQAEYILSFPRESDEGIYLKKATAISVDLLGNIHVVDSGQNKILVFSKKGEFLKSLGRSGQGPGDLLAPEKICFDAANTMYVYESANGRIQSFNSKGEYIRGFKVYKYIQALRVWGKRIYCVCKQQVPNNPLIEILDLDGKMLGVIGTDKRIDKIEGYRQKSMDFKKLDISGSGKIWFAWEYFSWIQGFSLEGVKHSAIDLTLPRQAEWSRQNLNALQKAPSGGPRYRSVIFAIRARGEFLYLLSSSENGAEIIVCSPGGGKALIYKLISGSEGDFHYYKDFDLTIEDGKLTIFLLQVYPDNCVEIYTVNEPGRGVH